MGIALKGQKLLNKWFRSSVNLTLLIHGADLSRFMVEKATAVFLRLARACLLAL